MGAENVPKVPKRSRRHLSYTGERHPKSSPQRHGMCFCSWIASGSVLEYWLVLSGIVWLNNKLTMLLQSIHFRNYSCIAAGDISLQLDYDINNHDVV